MPVLKAFRALRYDPGAAGPLDSLVAPPHDVIAAGERERLWQRSPYNIVRLIRPDSPEQAARDLADWRACGALIREERPAIWTLEQEFVGPDGIARTRRGLVARAQLAPYSERVVLPHERTFSSHKRERYDLLRAVRTKLSPVFLLHDGPPPPREQRPPDLEATLDGVRSRLWRADEPAAIASLVEAVRTPLVIADGHHRYETARLLHEQEATAQTSHVLAVLVSTQDPGLVIFPTHRLVRHGRPELDGRFTTRPVGASAAEAIAALQQVPPSRPAFAALFPEGAVVAETDPVGEGPLAALDTLAVDALGLEDLGFTPSAEEAQRAVRCGEATAALLVRPPSVELVREAALAGETMPQKSTYFFPKLASGLLLSPLDE